MLTRRSLLQSALALSGVAAFAEKTHPATVDETTPELSLRAAKPLAGIPINFIGLGYEMSSVAKPGLLSRENAPYVQLLRNLGPKGVLRLGGIVSDFTSYSASGDAKSEPKNTVITRASLNQLRAFLDAVDWTAIWSVNFARNTLEETIAEAREVSMILGPRLNSIELGNEVENYGRGKERLRPPPYNYETYRAEYTRWRAAILAAVPTLRFAAPDTAASVEWVERMASDAHGDVELLTTHYYRGDQKLGTQDQLMEADAGLKNNLERLRQASKQSGIPWRMCETNSFYGGGRPGVSNTLAGALWTLDFMLLLAQYGCAGVNIETGVNQLGFISSYSPIQDDGAGHNTAGIPYYGMLAFAAATKNAATVMAVEPEQRDAKLAIYTLGDGKRAKSVVLINKARNKEVHVSLENLGLHRPTALRLEAPSLDSTTGVSFGGAVVDATGHWAARPQPVPTKAIDVPPGSAVVLRSSDH